VSGLTKEKLLIVLTGGLVGWYCYRCDSGRLATGDRERCRVAKWPSAPVKGFAVNTLNLRGDFYVSGRAEFALEPLRGLSPFHQWSLSADANGLDIYRPIGQTGQTSSTHGEMVSTQSTGTPNPRRESDEPAGE